MQLKVGKEGLTFAGVTFILRTKGLRNATTPNHADWNLGGAFHTQNKGIKECNDGNSERVLEVIQLSYSEQRD